MGVFDYLRCEYSLPGNWNKILFQTKDTPAQWLDLYVIAKDGTLWHENYDIEDRSDPQAEGIMKLAGCMTRVNKRLEFEPLTGEIEFYEKNDDGMWIRYSAYFVAGYLKEIHFLED